MSTLMVSCDLAQAVLAVILALGIVFGTLIGTECIDRWMSRRPRSPKD